WSFVGLRKSLRRRDAVANTRDACATRSDTCGRVNSTGSQHVLRGILLCAPQRFGFRPRKQRQRRVVFLTCPGAERDSNPEQIEAAAQNRVLLVALWEMNFAKRIFIFTIT